MVRTLPPPPLRKLVLRQYKDLLCQANQLFDLNARNYIANRIRARFRDNMFEQGAKRLDCLIDRGRQYLQRLKRANLGDIKAMDSVLNHTYGRIGKRKHQLLQPYLTMKSPDEEASHPNGEPTAETETAQILEASAVPEKQKNLAPLKPRRQAPMIPAPIKALMKHDSNVNEKFVLANPAVYSKTAKSREINAMQKHYSAQLEKLRAPLRLVEVQQIQALASRHGPIPPRTSKIEELDKKLTQTRLATGRFQGNFHRITPRFLRRRYQNLIKGYIPMISQAEGGAWKVELARLPESVGPKIPQVHPRHMHGCNADGSRCIDGL